MPSLLELDGEDISQGLSIRHIYSDGILDNCTFQDAITFGNVACVAEECIFEFSSVWHDAKVVPGA